MSQFTLEQAEALLPRIRTMTAEAVGRVDALAAEAQAIDDERHRAKLVEDIRSIIERWATAVIEMGAEVKGLWLVDFDSGEGYFCWKHPEASLEYFHGYDEGFAGRRPIEPDVLH